VNLPIVVIEEPSKFNLDGKPDIADINNSPVPGNSTANAFFSGNTNQFIKDEIMAKTDNDMKSKSMYDNKIFKTKVNFVDKDKPNIPMSNTQYNSSTRNEFDSKRESPGNVNYVQQNKMNYKYNKVVAKTTKKSNYSLEKLEPDFNFKTAMLQFDPFVNAKKVTKQVFNLNPNAKMMAAHHEMENMKKRSRS